MNSPSGSFAPWRSPPPQPATAEHGDTISNARAHARRNVPPARYGSRAAVPSLPVPEGLERDGVALRRLRARDAGAFAAAFREDPALGVAIGAEEDPTENGVRRFIARQPGLRARGEFLGLAVTDATKRPFLGHVMLHTVAWRHRRAEVGYWLVPGRARPRRRPDRGRRCSSSGRSRRSTSSGSRSPPRPRTRPRGRSPRRSDSARRG